MDEIDAGTYLLGEDTASPDRKRHIERAFSRNGLPLYWIGNVTDRPGIEIEMQDGQMVTPTVQGFVHKLDGYKLFE